MSSGSLRRPCKLLRFTQVIMPNKVSRIVEVYRAVGSLNDSFQSSNFLLLLLLFFIDFCQWQDLYVSDQKGDQNPSASCCAETYTQAHKRTSSSTGGQTAGRTFRWTDGQV